MIDICWITNSSLNNLLITKMNQYEKANRSWKFSSMPNETEYRDSIRTSNALFQINGFILKIMKVDTWKRSVDQFLVKMSYYDEIIFKMAALYKHEQIVFFPT